MHTARGYMTVREPLAVGVSASQDDGVSWLKSAARRANQDGGSELTRAIELYDHLLSGSHISTRRSCLPDFTHDEWDKMTLFRTPTEGATPWFSPPLQHRMAIFSETARRLAREAFRDDLDAPNGMIQVSCTGYDSPHALQRTICEKGWAQTAKFWHIGHMGCYASIPALSMACSFASDECRAGGSPRRSSVLFIELCSLHCRPEVIRTDQVVMNYLFADGSVRLDVSSHEGHSAFAVLGSGEAIIPDTTAEMTWTPSDSAFDMVLTPSVPARIARELVPFVERFLRGFDLEIKDVAHFAIHPGGPRIIEMVASRLGLQQHDTRHSIEVLRKRGNMSSATLPHIWHLMQEDPAVRPGDLVMSLAFGPGLTVTSNLLQRVG